MIRKHEKPCANSNATPGGFVNVTITYDMNVCAKALYNMTT